MSKMIQNAMSMFTSTFEIVDSAPKRIANYKIRIDCSICGSISETTIAAICRQKSRGNGKYLCPSCSGKEGWTSDKKQKAVDLTKAKWRNPIYAGQIQGKAIAKEIIRGNKKPGRIHKNRG